MNQYRIMNDSEQFFRKLYGMEATIAIADKEATITVGDITHAYYEVEGCWIKVAGYEKGEVN